MLVTVTDNAKFGSTYSAKKVSLEGPGVMDPFTGMMMGGSSAFDDLDDEDLDGGLANVPKDTIET